VILWVLIVSSQHVIPLFDFFCHRYNIQEIFGPISGFFLHVFKCFRQFSVLFVECAIVVLVKIKKNFYLSMQWTRCSKCFK